MEKFEATPGPREIGEDFARMTADEFREFLRSLKGETHLNLSVDLSDIADQTEFKRKARFVKGFLEAFSPNQRRSATIKATDEQVAWEPNVFSSGIARG